MKALFSIWFLLLFSSAYSLPEIRCGATGLIREFPPLDGQFCTVCPRDGLGFGKKWIFAARIQYIDFGGESFRLLLTRRIEKAEYLLSFSDATVPPTVDLLMPDLQIEHAKRKRILDAVLAQQLYTVVMQYLLEAKPYGEQSVPDVKLWRIEANTETRGVLAAESIEEITGPALGHIAQIARALKHYLDSEQNSDEEKEVIIELMRLTIR